MEVNVMNIKNNDSNTNPIDKIEISEHNLLGRQAGRQGMIISAYS